MNNPYRDPPPCDHGVTFDEAECLAEKAAWPPPAFTNDYTYALHQARFTRRVRERWPRLHGECPKGCGFNGIAYASRAHYAWGDW